MSAPDDDDWGAAYADFVSANEPKAALAEEPEEEQYGVPDAGDGSFADDGADAFGGGDGADAFGGEAAASAYDYADANYEELPDGVQRIDLVQLQRPFDGAVIAMERAGIAFARTAKRSLPFLLRYRAALTPTQVEVVTGDYEPPLSEGATFAIYLGAAGGVRAMVHLNTEAVVLVLEGALGASGSGFEVNLPPALSGAQRAVLGRVVSTLAHDFIAGIRDASGLQLQVLGTEPPMLPPSSRTGELVVCACYVEGLEFQPCFTLVCSASPLEASARSAESRRPQKGDPRMRDALVEVPVDVIAELGRVQIDLRRLMALKVGDVIRLPGAMDDPVVVRVSGEAKFHGIPKISRGQLAIEIVSRHDK
jgi:flagellar motor switch protein FliM